MTFRIFRYQRLAEAFDGKLYSLYFLAVIVCGFLNNIWEGLVLQTEVQSAQHLIVKHCGTISSGTQIVIGQLLVIRSNIKYLGEDQTN